jgi:hypothetical protein
VRLVDEKSWMEDDGLYFLVGSGDLGWCVWLTEQSWMEDGSPYFLGRVHPPYVFIRMDGGNQVFFGWIDKDR